MRHHEAELHALLEPGAKALGFELVMLELVGSGPNTVLRVFVDNPRGVTVEDCADVSHQLSAILDVEDPIVGHYTLEVSSPGLDRPLVKREHFEKVIGQKIKVWLRHPMNGCRKFSGRLREMRGEYIIVEVDGEFYELPLGEVEKARLVPES